MKLAIRSILVALCVFVVGEAALAGPNGNDLKAEWTFAFDVWKRGFRSCPEADAAFVAYVNSKFPQYAACDGAVCTASTTGQVGRRWILPGGTCQGIGIIVPICDGTPNNPNTQYDPAKGTYCEKKAYSDSANAGECQNCTEKAGNPVNTGTGSKFHMETDYVGSGPFPLRFTRYFNSIGGSVGTTGVGRGWTHSYDRRLITSDPASGPVLVSARRGDAKIIPFSLSNGVYVGDPTFAHRLERISGGYRLTNPEDEVELYNEVGQLLSITDRVGRTQTLTYDQATAQGLLLSVADPQGRTLSFTYAPSVNGDTAMTMTAPGGLVFQYEMDPPAPGSSAGGGRLGKVTFPDGKTRRYGYPDINAIQLISITDENGAAYASYQYQFLGNNRVQVSQHAGSADTFFFGVWDVGNVPRNNQISEYTDFGSFATRTYTMQNIQGVALNTAISGPPCPTCGPKAQTYDTGGNRTSSTDWNDNRTNYTWDTVRKLETQRVEGLTAGGGTTAQTRTISTQWDTVFRTPTVVAEPLRITTNVYDPDGTLCGARSMLCSKTIQATTDANGSQGFGATPSGAPRVWSYTYNAMGRMLTVNGPRTDVSDVTTYTYYADNDADAGKRGNVASITNALGQTTNVLSYNAHGQPLTIVDPNGLTTEMTYDARQRLTSRTVGGETTTYDYDGVGQVKKVTLPDGSFLSYTYDDAHRLTRIDDNLGNHVSYTLDIKGNRKLEEVRDPLNALAQTRSRVYSNINRLTQENGANGQSTQYEYDNQGSVKKVTVVIPAGNQITNNFYDALNRLKQVTDPANGNTLYAYNGLNALTQVTDPRNVATNYTLDGLGDLNQQVSQDTGTTTSTYDAAGNLLTQTDAKGQVTTYTYDELNRVTLITFQDGSKQAYAYDQGPNALGRLSSIIETNPANQTTSIIAYAYDQHGRVTSETRTIAGVQYVLGYSYDSFGRLTGLTYPSGRTVTYGFDSLGRVNSVSTTRSSQTQSVVSNVTYHPFGGVNGFTLGNGQVYSRPYDTDGRVSSYTLGAQSFVIAYDAANRITAIQDAGNASNLNNYGYDALDRLTFTQLPSTTYNYAYDAVGNRTQKQIGGAPETYTYSTSSNRIATLTPTSGPTRSFVFDNNGSTTDDGLNTYAYDTRGRMVQAQSVAGATTYQVNALGQRIRKTNSTDDRIFHYDTKGKLIAESDPGGTAWKREYIFLGDIPVGVIQ